MRWALRRPAPLSTTSTPWAPRPTYLTRLGYAASARSRTVYSSSIPTPAARMQVRLVQRPRRPTQLALLIPPWCSRVWRSTRRRVHSPGAGRATSGASFFFLHSFFPHSLFSQSSVQRPFLSLADECLRPCAKMTQVVNPQTKSDTDQTRKTNSWQKTLMTRDFVNIENKVPKGFRSPRLGNCRVWPIKCEHNPVIGSAETTLDNGEEGKRDAETEGFLTN